MKKTSFNKHLHRAALLLSTLGITFTVSSQTVSLRKKWETEAVLQVPESVIYDPASGFIYVSNINGQPDGKDGNGFISRLTTSGKIENLEWVKGLDAPKGMGIYKDKLYVSDISKVVIIDIATGKIEKSIEVNGAQFLNDITVHKNGEIYISDSSGKKIYLLKKNNEMSVWLDNSQLEMPNGLLALNSNLRLVDMRSGNFYEVAYSDKKLNSTAQHIPSGDGVVSIAKDEYLISNWNGEINHVKGNTVHKLLDTKDEKVNAADIWFIPEQKLLLIPTFFANKLVAYTVN